LQTSDFWNLDWHGEWGHVNTVVDVAKRLGIPDNVLYTWVSKFKKADQTESSDLKAMQAEVAKLKAELR